MLAAIHLQQFWWLQLADGLQMTQQRLRDSSLTPAGPSPMSASLRVSRGFHRLAIFLGAIPLILGSVFYFNLAWDKGRTASMYACAQEAFYKKFYANLSRDEFDRRVAAKLAPIRTGEVKVTDPDLKELGCSNYSKRVSVLEIFGASRHKFAWAAAFFHQVVIGLAITLAISLAVYVLVRAIGWIIGGFMAS